VKRRFKCSATSSEVTKYNDENPLHGFHEEDFY
jgi:hypothetical protein